jgi:mycofactocin system glycosyltransferase
VTAVRSAAPAADTPLPAGFRLTLDPSVKQLSDELWFGGSPARVVRLTAAGRQAWAALQHAPVTTRTGGRLARRLTDAGLAHPVPAPATGPADVVVAVPVRDRADQLARCLAGTGPGYPVVVVDDGSVDARAIARVVGAHGARLVRHAENRGPAAARNSALAASESEFVAFLDSDCVPGGDWIRPLLGHFADPLVAAVAPRIEPRVAPTTAGRYLRAGSSLDLGAVAARVAPRTRVAYVPTAALLVRRSALTGLSPGAPFDADLRVGEDVDLVWRLHAAGWRLRYDPGVRVGHTEPDGWRALLARRFRYGTSAAALARRHPHDSDPLVLHPWPAGAVTAALAGRPVLAAAAFGAALATTGRTLRRAGVPTRGLTRASAQALVQTGLGIGRYSTQLAAPALLILARHRPVAAAALLLAPALTEWRRSRADLDPVRFAAARIVDDLAYGAGVWAGCLRHRTLRPVLPSVVRRPVRIENERS